MSTIYSRKIILVVAFICALIVLGFFIAQKNKILYAQQQKEEQLQKEKERRSKLILYDVPFSSQAPNGNWANIFFETGCEETSAIMAMHWVNKTPLTKIEAMKEITSFTNFEIKKVGGFYYDLSAEDTANIMKEYFEYENVELVLDIDTNMIIDELYNGNLVLITVNGNKLHNPHYKGNVPAHMILVIGYDPVTEEFVTHDPGTRFGGNYRYSKKVIEDSLRDYPTGSAELIKGIKRNMIVVKPSGK